jgi:hypothetical protein
MIARTETLRAYRQATSETYQQSGIVKAWQRLAALSSRTCMACIALDGKVYPMSRPLVDHPNGRCTMIPLLTGETQMPPFTKASDWFIAQDEQTQRDMMGHGKYEAWKDGRFSIDDLATTHLTADYGATPGETALRDLVSEDERKTYIDMGREAGLGAESVIRQGDFMNYMERQGVKAEGFTGQDAMRTSVAEAMRTLSENGEALPATVVVDATRFEKFGRERANLPALFDHETGAVYLNPDAAFWNGDTAKVRAEALRMFETGMWSSDSLAHPVLHESGHMKAHRWDSDRHESLRRLRLSAEQRTTIAREVGTRATVNPQEFVAEVYAGLATGRTYSESVMEWYNLYGGFDD